MMDWSLVKKTWEKWASQSVSVGVGDGSGDSTTDGDVSFSSSSVPLKAALLLNYDPTGPSRLNSTIIEQQGIEANPIELAQLMDFIKRNAFQTDTFFIGPNQYMVTSIHDKCLSARCMNTSEPTGAGEGAIIMHTSPFPFLLVALYDGSIGSASRAMVAVDQFVAQLGRRNLL